jgi:hypothetical protein
MAPLARPTGCWHQRILHPIPLQWCVPAVCIDEDLHPMAADSPPGIRPHPPSSTAFAFACLFQRRPLGSLPPPRALFCTLAAVSRLTSPSRRPVDCNPRLAPLTTWKALRPSVQRVRAKYGRGISKETAEVTEQRDILWPGLEWLVRGDAEIS